MGVVGREAHCSVTLTGVGNRVGDAWPGSYGRNSGSEAWVRMPRDLGHTWERREVDRVERSWDADVGMSWDAWWYQSQGKGEDLGAPTQWIRQGLPGTQRQIPERNQNQSIKEINHGVRKLQPRLKSDGETL